MFPEYNKNWLRATIAGGHIVNIPFITFEQVEVVARGTFGEMYRAYWKSAEKTVALKCRYNSSHMGNDGAFDDFIKEVIYLFHLFKFFFFLFNFLYLGKKKLNFSFLCDL